MERQSVRVTIRPDRREIWVVSGSTVKDALFAASVPIAMPCGGHGRCGRCVVSVRGKVSALSKEEKERLPRSARGARLACVARIEGDATVTIPPSSRITIQKIVARGRVAAAYSFRPRVAKVFLGKREPRAMRALARDYGIGIDDIALSMTNPSLMDAELRADHEWRLGLHSNATLVAMRKEVIGFEAGDTTSECYGVAIDVGTNTVVASLVDLTSGRQLAVASSINPQLTHGDDVISRIRFSKTAGGLDVLRLEIVNLINGLIEEISRDLKVDRSRIYLCTAVGNTAMQHILMGVSPADLGRAPYRARIVTSVETLAARAGVEVHPDCRLTVPPVIGGFVGGDLVALIISQALHRRKRPVLAVDLGTNGEIVLACDGKIAACSTAAGPAFEGERISDGVRAIEGAIEDVRIGRDGVKLKTIGRARPVGLCGSGLLAAVAEAVRAGVIEANGRIRTREEMGKSRLAERIVAGERGREFILCARPPIRLRQGDIREVQLGKAAVCAGIKVLSGAAGIDLRDIGEVLIAGGFGSALKPVTVRAVGFLPDGLRGKIKVIGNSAIEGAKIFLTSEEANTDAREVAAAAQHIELFSRPEFKEEYYRAMRFPARILPADGLSDPDRPACPGTDAGSPVCP